MNFREGFVLEKKQINTNETSQKESNANNIAQNKPRARYIYIWLVKNERGENTRNRTIVLTWDLGVKDLMGGFMGDFSV